MSEFAHVSRLRYSEASNRTGDRPRACGAQESLESRLVPIQESSRIW